MNFKKILNVLSTSLFIFILIFSAAFILILQNTPAIAAQETNYEIEVLSLAGGDYGYPSPYAHYPRGPGGYKRNLIFDSLLERGEKGLIPWLAKDYEVRNNGKEYLFTLNEGVKWHDGKDFTAADVKFSFEYGLEHPLVWSDLTKDDLKKIEIIAENKVLITVNEANASLLYAIGNQRIIPQHIWQKVEFPKEYTKADAVVGTGPYCLSDYNKEHGSYKFEAFSNFWGPKAKVKTIKFIPVSEEILAFEKGEIDLIDVSPDLLARYQNDPQFKVVQKPAFWGYRLIFNLENVKELESKKLRQAINYAIDKQELINKIERGAAKLPSAGIIPPDSTYYNPQVKKYNYNPEKTKELINETGFKKLNFNLKIANRTVRMAELIKEQLAEVGIQIKLISSDTKTQDSRINQNNYQLAITGHGGWGGEPDYLIARFGGTKFFADKISSSAAVGYQNDQLANLLVKQSSEFEPKKRQKILAEIQSILAEELPEIPLYFRAPYSVYRPANYNNWMFMYDHHSLEHGKLSYLNY
ncbi:ABC transporter substrate-binding protein [Halanaerobium praevalens]|uniref:Extracellular solute-binding protein family 5 n=1 Tax=Halanaerobium praevalens (strain ATCC 33744 / DSM 2228 / GSL) TaxID=572479 RepID=E3DM64_HALPG|nr:ABC transporter substrate-binding protein [Halanaerobium praevalens]ADO77342.1 extracellular solute-binding protein family 5 [Halanaerobium praevalens DSM 2228]